MLQISIAAKYLVGFCALESFQQRVVKSDGLINGMIAHRAQCGKKLLHAWQAQAPPQPNLEVFST